jgi:hypothetical protein
MKMNKLFFALSFVVMLGVGVCSCGGGDDNTAGSSKEQGGGGQGGGGGEGSTPMSKAEQTAFLESTAREFVAMAPASDFEDLAAMFKEARKLNAKNVDNWANGIFEDAVETLSDQLISSNTSDYYSSYGYERHFKVAYVISNYKGHFEVQDGKWVLVNSNVDDLKFTFKDSNNDVWVLRAEATGPFKKVHMFDLHDRDYEYSYSDKMSVYKYYEDYKECVISVPKTLAVTLTKNSAQMVKTTVNAELSDITGEEFDISKDNISASVAIEVKDYKINVSQVAYQHNSSVAVNMTVAKGSKQMLSVAVSGDLSGIPSVNVSAFSHHIDSDTWKNTEGNALVKVDILGKVQIQGKATKIHAIVDKLEAAKKNRESESDFKSYIKEANEFLDLGLYFNNHSLKQATAYLEPFEKTGSRYVYPSGYQTYKYWGWDMVIKFDDESSYSTMANYFSRSNFRSVYGDVEALIDSYSKLIKK